MRMLSTLAADGLFALAAVQPAAAAGPADLFVEILPPARLSAAGTIEYVVNVTNIGGLDAHNVALMDDLPTNAMWQSVSSSVGTCAFGPFAAPVDLQCNLGTLAPGIPAQVRIVIHPFATAQVNRAWATTSDPGASYANNSATHSMVLPAVSVSNLEVRMMTDRPDPLRVGGVLTYTVDIHNIGDDSARDVYLTDYLPPSVRFLNAWTSAGPSCANTPTPYGEAVFCKLYTVNNAASASVTIVVQPLAPGVVYNTVGVGLSTVDPNQVQDNSYTVRTYVNP